MRKINGQKMIIIIVIILLTMVVSSCSSPAQTEEAPPPETVEETVEETEELPVFTLESLAEYDGKEGRPAYVAVDGVVYDFTELSLWSGGSHNGYEAGQDLTEALHEVSPHGDTTLDRAPAVGTLEE